MNYLRIGSHATNLGSAKDVFLFCLRLLSEVNPTAAARQRSKDITKLLENNVEPKGLEIYQLSRALVSIVSDLNRYVPPFTYFGHHPTDSSNIGVWIDTGQLHKAENEGKITQVSSDNWRGVKSPYVLHVSSGLVLYRRKGKKELWRIT